MFTKLSVFHIAMSCYLNHYVRQCFNNGNVVATQHYNLELDSLGVAPWLAWHFPLHSGPSLQQATHKALLIKVLYVSLFLFIYTCWLRDIFITSFSCPFLKLFGDLQSCFTHFGHIP
jgi:hypothetical protein